MSAGAVLLSLPPVPEPPLPSRAFFPQILTLDRELWWGHPEGQLLEVQSLAACLAVSAGGLRVEPELSYTCLKLGRASFPLAFAGPWSRCGS